MFGIDDAALAGAGIVSNIIGGIAGSQAGAGDRAAGTNAVNQAYQQLAAVGLPPNMAKPIIYQQFQQKGILTPELEQTINQHPSLAATATGSDQANKAQMQALQILQQTGQTGMTPQSQAALNQIRQQVSADTNAKQQAIQQQFAARGEGGSGAQLIGQLQAAQSGANQESTAGDQVGAMASQNALQAIGQAGTLGGQIQNQQFGEQFQKGQAQDVINQFNAQNQVNQQMRNVGSQNQAQAANLGNAQQLSNANTQQANQELLRQNQAQNQQYLETLSRAQAIDQGANQYAGQMNDAGSAASQAAAAPWQAIGAGATTLGTSSPSPSSGNTFNFGSTASNNTGYGNENTMGTSAGDNDINNNMFAYNGGVIPKYNEGGNVSDYQGGKYTDFRSGTGKVPGQASVPGDDPSNDTVKAMLSPGEEVVPRSLAKTTFGKKLAKLLEQHHEVMKHAEGKDLNNE